MSYVTRGSLSLSRAGLRVTPDDEAPPENAISRFTGDHPVGGPVRVATAGPPRLRTEAIEDAGGDSDVQFLGHARDFLDCIRSRRGPLSDLVRGHRVVTLCHLANLSLRLGRQLRWDATAETVLADPEAAALLVRPYRAPWDAELRGLGADLGDGQ
jgi:Oxidoreductase family, C-terminal alpha/beta domain